MSTPSYTTPKPSAPSAESVLRWIGGGLALAAVIVLVAIAVWPASEADKAYDDGVQMGNAIEQLYYADSTEDVDAALAEVDAAAVDAREHGGDAVAEQAAAQQDALDRAVDGYVGAVSTSDSWEAELYEEELDAAVTDLANNADDFRTNGPEVVDAYWDGVEDGLNY